MQQHSWYVLTGGPGSGKTTLIEELKKRGHNTIRESARSYIEKERAKGRLVQDIRKNEAAFQEAIFREKQIIHEALSTNVVTFFDRGYHDTLAYAKCLEYEVAAYIANTCKAVRYRKVFILDMLPYVNDEARIEDRQTAEKLHEALRTVYKDSGHEIVQVPVLPVHERAQFILDRIESPSTSQRKCL